MSRKGDPGGGVFCDPISSKEKKTEPEGSPATATTTIKKLRNARN